MKNIYEFIIVGEVQDVAEFSIPIVKDNRFLSDDKNVTGWSWFPLTADTQVIELKTSTRPTNSELGLLTAMYPSFTVATVVDGYVTEIFADGVVNDETVTPR